MAGSVLAAGTALLTVLIVYLARRYNIGGDSIEGVQRAHSHWAPRLGGVPIFIAFMAWLAYDREPGAYETKLWLLCLLPAFSAGLAEDLTRKVGPWPRLLLTMVGACLAWFYLDVRVDRLGPGFLDNLLHALPLLSFAVTLLFVGGAAHAINIIDGYNGLASSYAMVVLTAVLVMALRVHDALVVSLAMAALAATFGFFLLNFPYGRIFLGDSGSYFLGTVIAFLLVTLTSRHADISPMFAAVLLVYPVWETLFSMYRRRVLRGEPSMAPDAAHLHSLLHKRLVRSNFAEHDERARLWMNSLTTVYALAMPALCAIAALLLWRSSLGLLAVFLAFIGGYMGLYQSLVRFRTPRRLSVRRNWGVGSGSSDMPALEEAESLK